MQANAKHRAARLATVSSRQKPWKIGVEKGVRGAPGLCHAARCPVPAQGCGFHVFDESGAALS